MISVKDEHMISMRIQKSIDKGDTKDIVQITGKRLTCNRQSIYIKIDK